jgi:hypothetical protein
MPEDGPFRYRVDVLHELWRHGVQPTAHSRPELVREFVRELYKYEIRRLKGRMLREEFPRPEYSARVDALRRQYPVLALLPHQFVE